MHELNGVNKRGLRTKMIYFLNAYITVADEFFDGSQQISRCFLGLEECYHWFAEQFFLGIADEPFKRGVHELQHRHHQWRGHDKATYTKRF